MTHKLDKNDEPIIPAMDVVASWAVTWPRVIARAWMDDKFKARLLKTPEAAFEEMGFISCAEVCGQSMNIWDLLTLHVVDGGTEKITNIAVETNPENSQYFPPNQPLGKNPPYTFNGWSQAIENGQLKMQLTLVLPPAPEAQWQATALNDWNAAGKIFPITLPCFC